MIASFSSSSEFLFLQCNSAKNGFLHKVIAFCDFKSIYKCKNGANLPGPPTVGM